MLFNALFSGCAKHPYQRGTWYGEAARTEFYTYDGHRRDALCLRITDGSRIGDKGFHGFVPSQDEKRTFLCTNPILVDSSLRALNWYALEGRKLKVTGRMQAGFATDPFDHVELSKPKPNAPVDGRMPMLLKVGKGEVSMLP